MLKFLWSKDLGIQRGSGSEWHSDKMTRSSNRHGASLRHGGSLWHRDKMTRCVNLAKPQNDTVRHFAMVCHYGTEGLFGTVTKCLSFNFFKFYFWFLCKIFFLTFQISSI